MLIRTEMLHESSPELLTVQSRDPHPPDTLTEPASLASVAAVGLFTSIENVRPIEMDG